ncbi:MAG: hypothetical protein IPH35_18970 [Rhodoferax sp.]|nr:hypothetical protein [Rhodoferax sp.]
MALDFWLASLKRDVTDVTDVTASIHAGSSRYVRKIQHVTDVTNGGQGADGVTSVTAEKRQTLQLEPAWILAVTSVTAVTSEKMIADGNSSSDRWCWPHSDAMNGSELALMATRLAYFARLGLDINQAERLADKLLTRDREHLAMACCAECRHLVGAAPGWRCCAYRARGVVNPALPRDLVTMLQRCPVFQAAATKAF